jgi:hypothetical protein
MDGVVLTPTLQRDLETANLWKVQRLLDSRECKHMREVAFSANRERHSRELRAAMEEEAEEEDAPTARPARAPILVRKPFNQTHARRADAGIARVTGFGRAQVGRGRLPQRHSSDRALPEVSEGGRRRRRAKSCPGRIKGVVCLLCAETLRLITLMAEADGARISAAELKNSTDKDRQWNLRRLHVSLHNHLFDVHGNYETCRECASAQFGVGYGFLNAVHGNAIQTRGSPLTEKKKEIVLADHALLKAVVVPSTYVGGGGSKSYVESLPTGASVKVRHGRTSSRHCR